MYRNPSTEKSQLRYVLLFLALVAVLTNVFLFRENFSVPPRPPQTASLNQMNNAPNVIRGDKIPGNPEAAEAQLRALYTVIQTYRNRNGGFPDDASKLILDATDNPATYGMPTTFEDLRKALFQTFNNNDMKFADGAALTPNPEMMIPWMITNLRQDGTRLNQPKRTLGKDVLAWSEMYFHRNIHIGAQERTTTRPMGFYLVLWEDGQIQRIPYDQVRFAPHGRPFPERFAGQAGEPVSGSLSYQEFEKWKERPHPKPKRQ